MPRYSFPDFRHSLLVSASLLAVALPGTAGAADAFDQGFAAPPMPTAPVFDGVIGERQWVAVGEQDDTAVFKFAYLPTANQLDIRIDREAIKDGEAVRTARLMVIAEDGQTLLEEEWPLAEEILAKRLDLPVQPLTPYPLLKSVHMTNNNMLPIITWADISLANEWQWHTRLQSRQLLAGRNRPRRPGAAPHPFRQSRHSISRHLSPRRWQDDQNSAEV